MISRPVSSGILSTASTTLSSSKIVTGFLLNSPSCQELTRSLPQMKPKNSPTSLEDLLIFESLKWVAVLGTLFSHFLKLLVPETDSSTAVISHQKLLILSKTIPIMMLRNVMLSYQTSLLQRTTFHFQNQAWTSFCLYLLCLL